MTVAELVAELCKFDPELQVGGENGAQFKEVFLGPVDFYTGGKGGCFKKVQGVQVH